MLCKIVGVYQIGYHNRETGKRSMEQVGKSGKTNECWNCAELMFFSSVE